MSWEISIIYLFMILLVGNCHSLMALQIPNGGKLKERGLFDFEGNGGVLNKWRSPHGVWNTKV